MAAHYPLITFLCLAAALLTAGAPVENDHGCPEGWNQFGTRCFKFFNSKIAWAEAEFSCNSHDAHLASIHSAKENTFVANLCKEAGEGQYTWIGGQDKDKETSWKWMDGSDWDYSKWHPGQPDNAQGDEHYTVTSWQASFWFDLRGGRDMTYICAKDAEPEATDATPTAEPEATDAAPKAEPGAKSVSLTLEGLMCKCTCN